MSKLLTLLLLLMATICSGQIDSTVVPVVSYWSIGDSYNFKVTKLKKNWKAGKQVNFDSSSYVVNFSVIDSTESSYRIKWKYKTSLSEFNISDTLLEKFSKYQMTEVIYQTSEVGELIGVENWEEISAMMKDLFMNLIDVLSAEQGRSKDELVQAMQPIMNIYESKEGIELFVFKELQFFHFLYGLEYSVVDTIRYEEALPNMMGGNPIRGDAKLYFTEVDFDNAFCVMMQEMKLNSEDAKELLVTLFKRMGLDSKEMQDAMKTAQFDIVDKNMYAFYYYPGIPYMIESNRSTIVDMADEQGRREEITRIELLD